MPQTTHELLVSLLPDGPYSKEIQGGGSPPQYALVLQAAAAVLDALDSRVDALLAELFPGTAVETLAEWEAVFDLHPATGATVAQRQAAVLAAWQLKPSMSVPYIEGVLETLLGVPTVTITEFTHPIYGPLAGDAHYDTDSYAEIFRWIANVSAADAAAAGLGADDYEAAFAMILAVKPAHTLGVMTVGGATYDNAVTPYEWGAYQ